MKSDSTEWDQELVRDPDFLALSREEQEQMIRIMEKMMEMGIAAVYGDEDPGVADSSVDCERRMADCRAVCCTFRFALTKEEVQRGQIQHDLSRPFFIRRDRDGYCPHMDRKTMKCLIWEGRPLRCRRYDCRSDPEIWPAST